MLTGWSQGYLAIRSMYDVQISSRYNNVYEENDLPGGNYDTITSFMTEKGIDAQSDLTFSLYLPQREDFHKRVKLDFPAAAISLQDYNALRRMLGHPPITLDDREFATQWQTIATPEERAEYLCTHTKLETDAGVLKPGITACLYGTNGGDHLQFLYRCTVYLAGCRLSATAAGDAQPLYLHCRPNIVPLRTKDGDAVFQHIP